jgi:hypothetical protein
VNTEINKDYEMSSKVDVITDEIFSDLMTELRVELDLLLLTHSPM